MAHFAANPSPVALLLCPVHPRIELFLCQMGAPRFCQLIAATAIVGNFTSALLGKIKTALTPGTSSVLMPPRKLGGFSTVVQINPLGLNPNLHQLGKAHSWRSRRLFRTSLRHEQTRSPPSDRLQDMLYMHPERLRPGNTQKETDHPAIAQCRRPLAMEPLSHSSSQDIFDLSLGTRPCANQKHAQGHPPREQG